MHAIACAILQALILTRFYYQLSHRMHYQILLDRGLLTQTEVNIVKDFDGDAYTLPLSWFVAICNEQLQSGALHPMTFKSLRDKVLLAISLLNFRTSFSAACLIRFSSTSSRTTWRCCSKSRTFPCRSRKLPAC